MSIGSISFWQQDQNFWARGQKQDQAQSQETALINVMSNAVTSLSSGLAAIANQTALNRVNSELSAAVQSVLQGSSSSSSSSAGSTSSSSTSSSPNSPISAKPATGTGTAPLTTGTTLSSLGFLPQGIVTVTDGTNTTTYKSTGTDTVGDLINAINANVFGKANVTASLDGSGKFVITGNNDTVTFTVGGTYAAAIGFAPGHVTFAPIKPAASVANTPSSSKTSSSSSSASSSKPSNTSSGIPTNSALALQTDVTAEILLATNGLSGNIVNFFA